MSMSLILGQVINKTYLRKLSLHTQKIYTQFLLTKYANLEGSRIYITFKFGIYLNLTFTLQGHESKYECTFLC